MGKVFLLMDIVFILKEFYKDINKTKISIYSDGDRYEDEY